MRTRVPAAFRLLALLGLVFSAGTALAKDFNSPFGYQVTLPDHWRVFSRDDIMKSSGQLTSNARGELKGWNPQVVSAVERQIASGNVEVFFNMKTSTPRFADNINVMRSRGRVPGSPEQGREACAEAKRALPQILGKTINMHDCGYTAINGNDALYMNITVQDAPYRTVQYMMNLGASNPLLFTLTVKHAEYYNLKREFDAIVRSVRAR